MLKFTGYGDSHISEKEGSYPCIRISDITDMGTIKRKRDRVYSSNETFLLKEGDIVFAKVGGKRFKSYLYDPGDGQICFASFLFRFHINEEETDPEYVRYFTISDRFQDIIRSRSRGSTRCLILPSDITEIELPHKDKETQEKVSKTLEPFYHSITLIEKKRNLLESYAWDLFHYSFQDQYEEQTLNDIADIHGGKARKSGKGNVPIYNSGGVTGMTDQSMSEKEAILVSKKGSLNQTEYVSSPFWASGTMCVILPKEPFDMFYLYFTLKDRDMERLNTDSVVPGVNMDVLKLLPIRIPPEEKRKKFDQKVRPVFQELELLKEKEMVINDIFYRYLQEFFG